MLLMKMPSKESVDLALSCQLHLAMKDLELLKPVNKLFWGGVFSTGKKKEKIAQVALVFTVCLYREEH